MKIGVIGTGLIGGSLGLALKSNSLWNSKKENKILCFNRRIEVSKQAVNLNITDQYCNSISELTEKSDVIIIATNLFSYDEISKKIAKKITPDKIISDVGSVKLLPSEIIRKNFGEKADCFIPAHPIAGKEISGINSADKFLYQNKKTIICTSKNLAENKIKTISEIWEMAGSKIEFLDAQNHDEIYAKISHFPQLISFANKKYISETSETKDFCRLQNSPQEMWQEIFHFNSENLKAEILNFSINFTKLKTQNKYIEIDENSNNDENFISAFLISKIIFENISEIHKNYAGSGFKSISSLAEKYKTSKATKKVLENSINIIAKIQNDLENWPLSRNF
ncbi:MAG: prephenate dehydrogenase [Rickettsiales bacterium]|nr:prephenate dehydrogenase [Rickettsiales bacterium]